MPHFSRNHNIENPNHAIDVSIGKSDPFSERIRIKQLNRLEYELIKTKDPNTIYIILDENDLIYYGSIRIRQGNVKQKYLMTTSENHGEYVIYLNMRNYKGDHLIEICRYNDPQVALEHLTQFNRVGSHDQMSGRIYTILLNYINKMYDLNQTIISMISVFGYKNDPLLQELLQYVQLFQLDQMGRVPPRNIVRKQIMSKMAPHINVTFRLYAAIFDLFSHYQFFVKKEKEYRGDSIDLSKEVYAFINCAADVIPD